MVQVVGRDDYTKSLPPALNSLVPHSRGTQQGFFFQWLYLSCDLWYITLTLTNLVSSSLFGCYGITTSVPDPTRPALPCHSRLGSCKLVTCKLEVKAHLLFAGNCLNGYISFDYWSRCQSTQRFWFIFDTQLIRKDESICVAKVNNFLSFCIGNVLIYWILYIQKADNKLEPKFSCT